MDTQRALGFLVRKTRLPANQLEQAREILRDIESLQPHNESLFQKVNFLMQAAMGYINIEQNKIMKFFSVVSVMFLPATLVASTYGMNFEFMPELHFKYGYPMAIGLMIGAALHLISISNGKVGYNGNFPNCIILGSIIDLYCLVLILRVWLPLANVDYYNPISQFTLKFTQLVIAPLRKVFPVVKKVETVCTGFSLLACGLKSVLFSGLNLNLFLLLAY